MTEHRVNESADKIVLKAEIKRGSGTRDQDKIKVKVKDDDPVEAVTKLNKCIDQLRNEGTAAITREIQSDE
ncbi:hypothetical protein OSG_eHP5_00080 [environmental Halophage eHP-5]|jgi:hypothetical protein|nr:hypothetical protein OSG_eHP5_00080 [environmental Halophage eHP-5]